MIDLEDRTSAEDAVVDITLAARDNVAVWTRVRAGWEAVLGGVAEAGGDLLTLKLRDGLGGDWRARGDRVLADLARSDRPGILMVDELAFLLSRHLRDEQRQVRADGPARVEAFLSWLRKNAQKHAGKLRLVLAGSTGIEPLARRAGASGTLNHLTPSSWSRGTEPRDAYAAVVDMRSASSARRSTSWSPRWSGK